MATFKRWRRAVIHHVSAQTVIVEYPNSVKITFREEFQGNVLFVRINAKPPEKVKQNETSSRCSASDSGIR